MDLKDKIIFLAQQPGPAGFEHAASAAAAEMLRPLADRVETDVLGNVIAWRRCGEKNAPTVMLDAHMDEIGLIITGYDRGFLRFACLGGVDERMLPATEVQILTKDGPIPGVVDVLPPHVVPKAEQDKPLAVDKLYIGAGFESEEEAKSKVPLGTPVVFATPCFALGAHRLCGKSLDDRSCAAILIHVLELLKDRRLAVDVAVDLAVQEEVGGRGALTGAYGIHPDYAVALDVTHGRTADSPRGKTMEMNGGPAIGAGPYMARKVTEALEAVAEKRGIPYQIEVMSRSTGTDADEIQTTREGVATGVLSLPLKYMHTPVEVIDLRDAEAAAGLLAAWLEDFEEVM